MTTAFQNGTKQRRTSAKGSVCIQQSPLNDVLADRTNTADVLKKMLKRNKYGQNTYKPRRRQPCRSRQFRGCCGSTTSLLGSCSSHLHTRRTRSARLSTCLAVVWGIAQHELLQNNVVTFSLSVSTLAGGVLGSGLVVLADRKQSGSHLNQRATSSVELRFWPSRPSGLKQKADHTTAFRLPSEDRLLRLDHFVLHVPEASVSPVCIARTGGTESVRDRRHRRRQTFLDVSLLSVSLHPCLGFPSEDRVRRLSTMKPVGTL